MLKVNISVSLRIPKTTARIWEGKKKDFESFKKPGELVM